MKYVYMNHRIREKKPSGPVIVVQEECITMTGNCFEINVGGMVIGHVVFDPDGLDQCETHDVRAWVEFNERANIRPIGKVICAPPPAKPVAEAKKPNSKVKVAK